MSSDGAEVGARDPCKAGVHQHHAHVKLSGLLWVTARKLSTEHQYLGSNPFPTKSIRAGFPMLSEKLATGALIAEGLDSEVWGINSVWTFQIFQKAVGCHVLFSLSLCLCLSVSVSLSVSLSLSPYQV